VHLKKVKIKARKRKKHKERNLEDVTDKKQLKSCKNIMKKTLNYKKNIRN
jgi:hypothetical protein